MNPCGLSQGTTRSRAQPAIGFALMLRRPSMRSRRRMRRSCMSCTVRRKLLVLHRPRRPSSVDIGALLRLQRTSRMLCHRRSLLLVRQFLLRRRSSGDQWRTNRRRGVWSRMIGRHRRILTWLLGRRLCGHRRSSRLAGIRRRFVGAWRSTGMGRLNVARRRCCFCRNRRVLHNRGPLCSDWRMGCIPT